MARLEEQLVRLFANARFAGAARVEVMTIHAAKGLEFDTVIVPGLQRYLPNYNRELLRWTRVAGPHGRHGAGAGESRRRRSRSDLSLDRAAGATPRRARARTLAVRGRHTRETRAAHARQRARPRSATAGWSLDEPRRGSMLRMLWGAVETMFWDTEPSAPIPAGYKPAPPQKLRRLPIEWRPPRTQLVDAGAGCRGRRHRGRAAGVRLGVAGEPPRRHARASRARSAVPSRHAGIARSSAARRVHV